MKTTRFEVIARMLGVRVDEPFTLENSPSAAQYRFTKNDFQMQCEDGHWVSNGGLLCSMLRGQVVARSQWTPEVGERYYFKTVDDHWATTTWKGEEIDQLRRQVGNIYHTDDNQVKIAVEQVKSSVNKPAQERDNTLLDEQLVSMFRRNA